MGVIASYYVVSSSDMEILKSEEIDFDHFMVGNVTKDHEYQGFWFSQNDFGQGLKSWNALIELVCILDTTSNEICRELLSKSNLHSETKLRPSFYLIKPAVAKTIFEELKKISLLDIELAVENPEVITRVVNAPGYHMNLIEYKEDMIIQFMELLNAFYSASQQGKGVIIAIH